MGAWIEISNVSAVMSSFAMSHPLWVRGLKYHKHNPRAILTYVAPFMGAWIEMISKT